MTAGKAAGAALALCAACALLVVRTGQAEAYGAPKLLAMSLCAAAAWAALAARGGWRRTPLDGPLAAAAGVYLASIAASADPFVGLAGHYSSHAYGLAGLLLCAAAFYATAWSDEPKDPDRLLAAALWAAGAASAFALLQKAGFAPAGARLHFSGRVGGTLGDPVLLGACLLLFVPVALHLAAGPRRAAAWVCGPLVASALLLTLSRGAWLGAAAGAGAQLWLSGRLRVRGRALLAGAVCAALLVAGGAVLRSRTGRSDSARVELWRSLAPAALERPLLGAGPDSVQTLLRGRRTEGFLRALGPITSQVSAHNDLLQALVTLGLLGLAAYLWALFGAWRLVAAALSDPRRRAAAAAAGGALIGLFVQVKVNPAPLPALVLAALMLGLLAPAEERPGGVPAKAAAAALCLVLALGAARLCSADRQLQLARSYEAAGRGGPALAAYRSAVRLNPFEAHYRLQHARYLAKLAAASPAGAARVELYDEAVRSGADLASRRPALADGWSLQGTYNLLAASEGAAGRLEPAREALDAALARDPYHPAFLENRLQVARALGETQHAARLSAELSRIQNIKR